ncbi:MAG: hypothetical protein HY554_01100 [Elusimicrobia bacterium]|nr:hypothetical protein [Elusimicrobiota bacterium]
MASTSLGLGVLLLVAAAIPGEAAEIIPMYQLSLMGGQYFFSGAKSSLNGNVQGNVAPAVKFSERWTLLPVYSVNFQGTKPVTDPVGSGTLFQQSMDHRLSVAGLYSDPGGRWKFKPSASYKAQFLKETRDEGWGDGLFDYHKAGVGFEVEDVYKDPFSVRIGYDFYYIRFPHFQSLESKSGLDPNGNPLGRETAGANVLDTLNNQFTIAATRPFPYDNPKVSLQATYSVNYQRFADQKLVDLSGQYQSSLRQDTLQSLAVSAAHPRPVSWGGMDFRLSNRFGVGASYNGSNQNNYDASRAQFISDAYSYATFWAGPSWSLAWGPEKAQSWTSLGFTFSRTQYLGRLVQDRTGQYLSEKQKTDRYHLSLGYGYPVAPNFSLRAQANFLWAESNMKYEATYRYTYSTANYLVGFSYDY